MTGELSKNFHGVGIGPLSKILAVKAETNKGDFRLYFELVEKGCRRRHQSEILKTDTKTLIWIQPQEFLGCQNLRQGPLTMPFEVWSANITPKLKNIQNTLRKQGFF